MTASSLKARVGVVLPYVAVAAVAIGMLNFFWFMSEIIPLDLGPSDGHVTLGHYFVYSKINGGYIEVTKSFYEWSRFHEASVLITWPFVIVAMWYMSSTQFSSRIGGIAAPSLVSERIQQHLPAPVELVGAILGTIVSVVLLWFGIMWFIPHDGLLGVVWTAVIIAITVANARRYWIGRRH